MSNQYLSCCFLLLCLTTLGWVAEAPRVTATCPGPGAILPGGQTTLAVSLAIPSGWHLYWSNPGDNGMPPKLTWELPSGWTADQPRFPVPKRHVTAGMVDFIHEGRLDLLVDVHAPATASPGVVKLTAKITYLICNEQCVPGLTTVSTEVAVLAEGTPISLIPPEIRAQHPVVGPVANVDWVARRQGDGVDLEIRGALPPPPDFPFLPLAEGVFSLDAPQVVEHNDHGWHLHLRLVQLVPPPTSISGVIIGIPPYNGVVFSVTLSP